MGLGETHYQTDSVLQCESHQSLKGQHANMTTAQIPGQKIGLCLIKVGVCLVSNGSSKETWGDVRRTKVGTHDWRYLEMIKTDF